MPCNVNACMIHHNNTYQVYHVTSGAGRDSEGDLLTLLESPFLFISDSDIGINEVNDLNEDATEVDRVDRAHTRLGAEGNIVQNLQGRKRMTSGGEDKRNHIRDGDRDGRKE